MNKLNKLTRTASAACLLTLGSLAATPANAVTELGFILDESGSIGSSYWSIITTGLANAINTYVPLGGRYEVSVVTFSTSATADIQNFLVTDAASRTSLANSISGLGYSGQLTNFAPAFDAMNNTLLASALNIDFSYVNFATDGQKIPMKTRLLPQLPSTVLLLMVLTISVSKALVAV